MLVMLSPIKIHGMTEGVYYNANPRDTNCTWIGVSCSASAKLLSLVCDTSPDSTRSASELLDAA